MSSTQVGAVLGYLRKLAADQSDVDLPDHQLLERFAAHRDEAAFAALLKRHGPMVLGVCRSVLHNLHDAEDAFQAAFLVLTRKAGSIHRREAVSAWLYRVAYHLAVDAQASAARRRVHEKRAAIMPPADPVLDMSLRELRGIVNEELQRLPEEYRAPLVLCALEEKPLEEAARLLGWTKGTVKGRLQRGRERLRQRLQRRGLDVSAGLLAVALSTSSTSAQISAALAASTLQAAIRIAADERLAAGVVSAKVAALVQGASRTMFLSKTKIVTVLFLAMSLAAVGVAWHRASAAGQEDARPTEAAKPTLTKPASDEFIAIRGQVVDPDGKPFAGAKLYLATWTPQGFKVEERAASGEDGRFEFSLAKTELDASAAAMEGRKSRLITIAKGYGPDWTLLGKPLAKDGLHLRLVKDVPIRGCILDADGKPVAGARLRVGSVDAYPGEDLQEVLAAIRRRGMAEPATKTWMGPLPGQPASITTGADGRFRLGGFGRERIITFYVEGPAIQYTTFQVMTRTAGTDAGPKVRGVEPRKIYGAQFEYLGTTARPIRGIVRDKATGKPIASVKVRTGVTTHTTRTDSEGRYELLGAAKSPTYTIEAEPPDTGRHFKVVVQVSDTPGLGPLAADIALVEGVRVRGKVTDKKTDKPVPGARLVYHPLLGNVYVRRRWTGYLSFHSEATSGPDGSFRMAALPGPGILAVTAPSPGDYAPALVTLQEWRDFFKGMLPDAGNREDLIGVELPHPPGAFTLLVQPQFNALALMNPEENAEAAVEVALRPALTRKGTMLGPDDKPLTGATVFGLMRQALEPEVLTSADFAVRGLGMHSKRTRKLLFFHRDKRLGRSLEVRDNETGPLKVLPQPCASAVGRCVDKDGQPVANLPLCLTPADLNYFSARPLNVEFRTGPDGRFRAEGLVPGQQYALVQPSNPQTGRPATYVTVEPGTAKDLGDVTDPGK
jgi:RNA polymerase sigma factor (sigma-70 family)